MPCWWFITGPSSSKREGSSKRKGFDEHEQWNTQGCHLTQDGSGYLYNLPLFQALIWTRTWLHDEPVSRRRVREMYFTVCAKANPLIVFLLTCLTSVRLERPERSHSQSNVGHFGSFWLLNQIAYAILPPLVPVEHLLVAGLNRDWYNQRLKSVLI